VSDAPGETNQDAEHLSRLAGRLKDRHQNFHVSASVLRRHFSLAAEALMATINHPTKQSVRAYLERRARDPKPPPTPEEIRRQLGWGLLLPDFKLAPSRNR
jgi:hypothetical protein